METNLPSGTPSPGASRGVAVAVLAAGQSKRFLSDQPKHLALVGGVPIVERVIRAGLAIEPDRLVAVVNEQLTDLPERLGMQGQFTVTRQLEATGTASAVMCALDAIGECEWLVSLLGDNPLLTAKMIRDLVDGARNAGARVGVLTAETKREKYGRIVREDDQIHRISEFKQEKPEIQERHSGIEEINSGIMVLDAKWAREALTRVRRDPDAKEFLLTDLIALAVSEHDGHGAWPVQSVKVDASVAVGVNDRAQQAKADAIVRDQMRAKWLSDEKIGHVTMIGQETIFIDETVEIGRDTIIHPFSCITGKTTIGKNCVIGPHAVIHNGTIGEGARIVSSTVTDSSVGPGTTIGPYAHLRDHAAVGASVRIGNFVEVKNSTIADEVKAGHLAYLGDATVGERVNIGAGVITANFNGVTKNRTEIGADAFIGSNTVLVAPRAVGERGRTAAGSVVTHDVPDDTLVVGVPARPRITTES